MADPVRDEPVEEKPPEPIRTGRWKTPEEREVFDAEVAKLRADRGLTFAQIAVEMKCAKETAWKGYKRFMVSFRKYHHSDQSVLLAEHHSRAERVWRVHMAKYLRTVDKETGVGDISILREAMKLQNEAFDRMQSAGLLPKADEHFKHGADDDLKAWMKTFMLPEKKKPESKEK
jgi:hypothetical protein